MNWLRHEIAVRSGFKVRGNPIPQYIELSARLESLSAEIPVEPLALEIGDIPGPSFQWYGLIGDRPIILEREQLIPVGIPERVFVHTSYLERQNEFGDWSVLKELGELPRSVFVMRPYFIASRNTEPTWVVYRRHEEGYNSPLYNACSRREADDCLNYLKQDSWNESCFVDVPEPEGCWTAIQKTDGSDKVLCRYPSKCAALAFACAETSGIPDAVLRVINEADPRTERYFVRGGRVDTIS